MQGVRSIVQTKHDLYMLSAGNIARIKKRLGCRDRAILSSMKFSVSK